MQLSSQRLLCAGDWGSSVWSSFGSSARSSAGRRLQNSEEPPRGPPSRSSSWRPAHRIAPIARCPDASPFARRTARAVVPSCTRPTEGAPRGMPCSLSRFLLPLCTALFCSGEEPLELRHCCKPDIRRCAFARVTPVPRLKYSTHPPPHSQTTDHVRRRHLCQGFRRCQPLH